MDAPVGIGVVDERPLAGRIVGWMYVVGAIVTTLLPLLPGTHGDVVTPTLPIGIAAFVWGVLALWRVDWTHAAGSVIHASALAGALAVGVAVHDTGGAQSPARILLLLVLVFAAYFFPAREAWPYLGLVLVLHGLPFAYDGGALDAGLLGELLIVAPCYWLLAFLLITGKRGMVTLRAHADRLARQDPLTGLANRRALLEAMNDVTGRVGLLMLDIDDFKAVNTRFGHPGGDRVLMTIAGCLRRSCRASDLPARLGGDEFAVLVPGVDADTMAALADRVLDEVRGTSSVRVSAGWVVSGRGTEQLLLEADQALAAAKRGGKDRALAYA
ncbi:MAG TPA: GGDEF domain-containing protein [Solirubrobacter sp.]|nr:GGDEF domain-containing protein [Solirubrobacter sp.]